MRLESEWMWDENGGGINFGAWLCWVAVGVLGSSVDEEWFVLGLQMEMLTWWWWMGM